MIQYVLILVAFIVDSILSIIFPPAIVANHMYFIPCIAFCAMILNVRKIERTDAYLMCMLCGVINDFFFANTFFVYFILYTILCFITRIWTKQINDSMIENVVLCISTIFLRELLVYLYMHISNQTALDFYIWLSNRVFLTIIVNALLIFVLVFISHAKDDYLKRKEVRLRREEKLPWMR